MYTQDVFSCLAFSSPETFSIRFLPALLAFLVLGMEAKASPVQGKTSATEQDPRLVFQCDVIVPMKTWLIVTVGLCTMGRP